MVILSILIPSYNRQKQVVTLINEFLDKDFPIEICVHDDGSDPPIEISKKLIDCERLIFSSGENQGRANAILQCFNHATGRFVMIYDDDDEIYQSGLQLIISYCQRDYGKEIAGFLFDMDFTSKCVDDRKIISEIKGNYLNFRADMKIAGDKKEVVLREKFDLDTLLLGEKYRRVPTSLYWSNIGMTNDAIYVPRSVGKKNYQSEGMTSSISTLKKKNTYPMFMLYKKRCLGRLCRRYKSNTYFLRCLLLCLYYGSMCFGMQILRICKKCIQR